MKKLYIITAVILLLSVMLLSCAEELGNETDLHETPHNSDTATEMESETEKFTSISLDNVKDYSIEKIDGKYYFVFDNPENYDPEDCFGQVLGYIKFDSLADMKDQIANGKLTESEKCLISVFYRDNVGIEIVNIDDLRMPTLPEGIGLQGPEVHWEGRLYYLYGDKLGIAFCYGTESYCKEAFEERYSSFAAKSEANISIEKPGDKASFTLESSNKKMAVTVKCSSYESKIRLDYQIIGYHDGEYFVVYFDEWVNGEEIPEIPDDAWFLSFGLTPYIQK